jgi:putative oxidoreductase
MPLNPGIAERRGFDTRADDDDHDEWARRDVLVLETGWQATMALLGRWLIAAIFLMSGIAKLTDTPGTVAHMTSAGIPYAETLAVVAGVAEIAGALSLILGLLTRVGAAGLILYMIPTTLIFHAFWGYEGAERLPQMVNFMKNLAIMGGLSILVGVGAHRYSVDHAMRRRHRY